MPRRGQSAPSATKNPIRIAVVSDAAVTSSASSAPLQYGPEESATQNRCVSKLANTSVRRYYLTSATGTLYLFAILTSAPVAFSFATPSLIC
jgi:hypothetical protein